MSNEELITTSNMNPIEVFKAGGSDQLIDNIRKQALSFVPDTSTAKGRKEIASIANRVSKSKVVIENARKELKSGLKAQVDAIDSEGKKAREALELLKIEVRKPLTDWEAEEQKKADAETERLRIEEEARLAEEARLVEVARLAEEARLKVIADEQEAKEKALAVREAELKAKELEAQRIAHEAELVKQAELKAKEDAEKAIQQAKENEQRAKIEAEMQVKQAEEAKAIALKKAEDDKANAIKVEQARVEAEAKIKADEEAKRKADEQHFKNIHNGIYKALVAGGVEKASAITAIKLISSGIDNIQINY